MIDRQFTIKGATILVWEITENEADLEKLLTNLDSYKSDLEKLTSSKRRLEFLTSRITINTLLNKNVNVLYDSNGKPLLENELSYISISHSKNWVAVIHHPTRQVGIDIEFPTVRINKIAHRFLNQAEQESFSDEEQKKEIQLIWSAKEALYKIIGSEVADFANQLTVLPFKVQKEGTFTALQHSDVSIFEMHYIVSEHFNLVFCIA
jgi:phosphopantetheinyl transferase